MGNICIIQRKAVCFLEPCAAFEDRLQIAVDRTWAVIDQLQDVRNVLEFRSVKNRIRVLHVLSFRNRFTSPLAKLFFRRGTSTLEVNGKIKYTHLAYQVSKPVAETPWMSVLVAKQGPHLWGFLLSETRISVNKKDHLGKRQSLV